MSSELQGQIGVFELGEALKTSARRLGERRGASAVAMLSKRLLAAIGGAREEDYSYIWRSAIEQHEQDIHESSYRSVLVDAVRDAALGATGKPSSEAEKCVETLLTSQSQVLVRIGIFVCGQHYGVVGHTFWKHAQLDWFTGLNYWHEVFWLVRNGFSKFSARHRQQFLEFVDQITGEEVNESERKEWIEEQQRDLLHPAAGQGDAEVDARYNSLVSQLGPVREHPDFHSYSAGGWIGERSPVTAATLVAASGPELERLLEAFTKEPRRWDGPTYRGFAATISEAVRASADGFLEHFKIFRHQLPAYQHGLFRGLKERWADDKRDIPWDEVVSLVEGVAFDPAFANQLNEPPADGWEPSVRWVVTDIADLLKSGASRERSLPDRLHARCIDVVAHLLRALPAETVADTDDVVSRAINSPRGRAIEAFIHIALAARRQEVEANSAEGCWVRVNPALEAELATSEAGRNSEFAALAGMYCVNFHYLNAQWTEANIGRIFPLANDHSWRCAAQGFSYQSYLHDWLYRHLDAGGHLQKMIIAPGLPSQVSKRAIEFVGVAYLKGLETFENPGLLASLVESLNRAALVHLSWFFWTLRPRDGAAAGTHGPKVLTFWRHVAAQIFKTQADVPELQSALSQLAVFLEELNDPNLALWEAVAPYAQSSHHGYVLLAEMARLVERFPVEVARVFRAALTSFLPDYRREDVLRCVEGLANQGYVEEAEEICNLYAGQHSDLLKDVYQKIRDQRRGKAAEASQ